MMNRGILCKITTSKAQATASINNTTSAEGEPASTEQLPPASSTAIRHAHAANYLLTATTTIFQNKNELNTGTHQPLRVTPRLGTCTQHLQTSMRTSIVKCHAQNIYGQVRTPGCSVTRSRLGTYLVIYLGGFYFVVVIYFKVYDF